MRPHNHETWFHRGREAAGQGRPRVITDGRLSHENRQSWYQGWDHETQLKAPKPTAEQAASFNAFFKGLASEAHSYANTQR